HGSAVLGAYAISKAADFQLARNLAVEFGPYNVRVNCVAPGLVKTDFARALWDNPQTLERALSKRRSVESVSPRTLPARACSSPPTKHPTSLARWWWWMAARRSRSH